MADYGRYPGGLFGSLAPGFAGRSVEITPAGLDQLARVVQSEIGAAQHTMSPAAYQKAVAEIVDVITNRAASPDFPDTISGVVNQGVKSSKIGTLHGAFSAVGKAGSASKLPAAKQATLDAVKGRLAGIMQGVPSTVPGAVNYLNPEQSSKRSMKAWGNAVVANPISITNYPGVGRHVFGVAPGFQLAPQVNLEPKGLSQVATAPATFGGPLAPGPVTELAALSVTAPTQVAQAPGITVDQRSAMQSLPAAAQVAQASFIDEDRLASALTNELNTAAVAQGYTPEQVSRAASQEQVGQAASAIAAGATTQQALDRMGLGMAGRMAVNQIGVENIDRMARAAKQAALAPGPTPNPARVAAPEQFNAPAITVDQRAALQELAGALPSVAPTIDQRSAMQALASLPAEITVDQRSAQQSLPAAPQSLGAQLGLGSIPGPQDIMAAPPGAPSFGSLLSSPAVDPTVTTPQAPQEPMGGMLTGLNPATALAELGTQTTPSIPERAPTSPTAGMMQGLNPADALAALGAREQALTTPAGAPPSATAPTLDLGPRSTFTPAELGQFTTPAQLGLGSYPAPSLASQLGLENISVPPSQTLDVMAAPSQMSAGQMAQQPAIDPTVPAVPEASLPGISPAPTISLSSPATTMAPVTNPALEPNIGSKLAAMTQAPPSVPAPPPAPRTTPVAPAPQPAPQQPSIAQTVGSQMSRSSLSPMAQTRQDIMSSLLGKDEPAVPTGYQAIQGGWAGIGFGGPVADPTASLPGISTPGASRGISFSGIESAVDSLADRVSASVPSGVGLGAETQDTATTPGYGGFGGFGTTTDRSVGLGVGGFGGSGPGGFGGSGFGGSTFGGYGGYGGFGGGHTDPGFADLGGAPDPSSGMGAW